MEKKIKKENDLESQQKKNPQASGDWSELGSYRGTYHWIKLVYLFRHTEFQDIVQNGILK